MTNAQAGINVFDVGQRLQQHRKRTGRTQLQVAEELGLSRPSVAAIEAGQRQLDSRFLLDLARAYRLPVSALVTESGPRVPLQAQFRLPADTAGSTREELERAVASLEALASTYVRLERLLENPLHASPVPRYGYGSPHLEQDAEGVAEAERRRLGIGDGPVFRLRALLEREAGLRIFHMPLPGAIAGLYGFAEEAGPCVAINAGHPLVRQRWSLAHEFAHFLTRLDRPEVTDVSRYQRLPEQERFAEQFAVAFLLPRSGLERRLRDVESADGSITAGNLLTLADEYEVSLQALTLRLEGLHLLPPGTWDSLAHSGVNIKAASTLLGLPSPASDAARLPRRFVFLALEAYDRELLTERELADVLGLDRLAARRVVEQLTTARPDLEDAVWDIPLAESMPVGH